MYQFYPTQQVIRVNGENGARAYQMSANSSVLLLDESAPLVWLKTTDGAGYPSLMAYDIAPHKEEPMPDIKSIMERLTRLEERYESDNTNAKRKTNAKESADNI